MAIANSRKRAPGGTLKLAVVWLAVFVLLGFRLSLPSPDDPLRLTVLPVVPRQGEPVMATLEINNPAAAEIRVRYRAFINGELVLNEEMSLAPRSQERIEYSYRNPLPVGEQVSFLVQADFEGREYLEQVSLPPYAPQVWSSFASFASFSTSLMGFMTTVSYYQGNFTPERSGWHVGVVVAVVLGVLLAFCYLTEPLIRRATLASLRGLRLRFGRLSLILLVIFLGMVYTSMALVMS